MIFELVSIIKKQLFKNNNWINQYMYIYALNELYVNYTLAVTIGDV